MAPMRSHPPRRLPRIAIGGILHETNTFASGTTGMREFHERVLLRGDDIVAVGAGSDSALGGVIDAARGRAMVVPTLFASAMPGPPVSDATFEELATDLLQRLRQASRGYPRLDGVVLLLHGAMVTETGVDPEGALLDRVREVVGARCPVVAVLDSHATVTDRMVAAADLLTAYRTYPHLDTRARGFEAMERCLDLVAGSSRPAVAHRKLPLLMPLLAQATDDDGPMREVTARADAWRNDPRIVSLSLLPGFPYADVPDAGASVIVYACDAQTAHEAAGDLAATWWSAREGFRRAGQPVDALAAIDVPGTVVVADIADNPGAGAGGDATHLLRYFLEHRLALASFACLPDPEAVATCHSAGVRAVVDLPVGGKSGRAAGSPVGGHWRVDHLGDGVFANRGPMATGAVSRIGRTATVGREGISVILCERRVQVVDPAVFDACGITPDGCRWLVVKSSVHFRAAFRSVAATMIEIEGKGLSASALADLAYNRIRRPVWPLDEVAGWMPPARPEVASRE